MKEILITSSVLIAVVLLLRWMLRGKVRQKLLYGAWLLVALRLLVPFQLGWWSFSLNTLTQTVTEQSETLQQAEQMLQTPVAGPSKEVLIQELKQEYLQMGLDPETPELQAQLEAQLPKTAPTLSQILKTVWLTGMGLMALWFGLTNLSFQRKARAGSTSLKTDAPVPVRVSSGVPTPCLVGLVRPVIYLTPECTVDPRMLRHVLTHETAHLRQWDPVWSLIRGVCLCIYWFHPLVWVAATQSRRDCELSCDESALRQLGDEERTAYGRTLLTMVRSASPAALLNTATSMSESKKQLKERMCFIVKKPRNLLIAAVALTLVIALAAGCAFTGGKTPEQTPPATEPTTEPVTEPTTESVTETTTQPPKIEEPMFPVKPVPEGEDPLLVRDGIFYKKNITITKEHLGSWKCPPGLMHSVRIPQMSVKTYNVTAFNIKIWRQYSACLFELTENREEDSVYWCDYQWYAANGIVGILVYHGRGQQAVTAEIGVDGYYYDLNRDRELTFEEYLSANGTTYDQVLKTVMDSKEYRQIGETDEIMLDCLLCDGKAVAVLRNYTADPGWVVVQTAATGVGLEPVHPLNDSDFHKTEFRKDTSRKDLIGTWIAHVNIDEEIWGDQISYKLELRKDGTAVYHWDIYGSDPLALLEGTWKPGKEEGTYILDLTLAESYQGSVNPIYNLTSVQQLRCSEDGTALQARWAGGVQLFHFYSANILLMYRYDTEADYYRIPVQDIS